MSIWKVFNDYRTSSFKNYLIASITLSTTLFLLGYLIFKETLLVLFIVYSTIGLILLPSELKKYKKKQNMTNEERQTKTFYLAFIGAFLWSSGLISWLVMKDTYEFPFAWIYFMPFACLIAAIFTRIAEQKGYVSVEKGFNGFDSGYLAISFVFMFTFWCLYNENFLFAYWFIGRPLIYGLCILYDQHKEDMPNSLKALLKERVDSLFKDYTSSKKFFESKQQ